MTTLPSDLDVARQLVSVRTAVIEATHHIRSPKRSTRYRTTRNLIIAAAAIAVLTAGAIIVILYPTQDTDSVAACYLGPDLDSTLVLVAGEHGSTTNDWDELCAVVWRNDLFDEANNNDPDPNDGTSPVPNLVACARPDGLVAVFPVEDGEGFCETLGLADWRSD